MIVKLNIEYSAEADREGETDADEQRVLDALKGSVDQIARIVRESCEAEGITDITIRQ